MKKNMTIWLMVSFMMAAAFGAAAQSFTVALKNGDKVTYRNNDVDSIYFHDDEVELPDPRIGDFYYSDGTWSTVLDAAKKPIGIVFRVGIANDARDVASYYTEKDGTTPLEKFHGYVVALNDATSVGGQDDVVWWSPFNNDGGAGCSTDLSDFLGYTNTLSILSRAGRDGGLTDSNYPAAYYATLHYENYCAAPEASSGWFLPSAGQMKYIYDRVYFDNDNSGAACVENSLRKLPEETCQLLYRSGAEYWTSTEKVDAYGKSNWAYYFCFDESIFRPGFVADYRKNAGFVVRSVLAF